MKIYVLLALLSFNLYAQDEETEALRAMRISCVKQKVGLGCFNYANMLIRADKEDLADTYFEKGCKLEHSPSCKKEKWEIPEPVAYVAPVKATESKDDAKSSSKSNSEDEVISAFDITAPPGYTPSSQSSSSNGPSNGSPYGSSGFPSEDRMSNPNQMEPAPSIQHASDRDVAPVPPSSPPPSAPVTDGIIPISGTSGTPIAPIDTGTGLISPP